MVIQYKVILDRLLFLFADASYYKPEENGDEETNGDDDSSRSNHPNRLNSIR